jgi:hypothetical protein
MVVLGYDDAFLNPIPQAVRRRLCHLPRGLPGRNQQYPARECPSGQRLADCRIRLYCCDRVPDNPVRIIP